MYGLCGVVGLSMAPTMVAQMLIVGRHQAKGSWGIVCVDGSGVVHRIEGLGRISTNQRFPESQAALGMVSVGDSVSMSVPEVPPSSSFLSGNFALAVGGRLLSSILTPGEKGIANEAFQWQLKIFDALSSLSLGDALCNLVSSERGYFTATAITRDCMFAVCDESGLTRPLECCEIVSGEKRGFAIATESCVLDSLSPDSDKRWFLNPGQFVKASTDGEYTLTQILKPSRIQLSCAQLPLWGYRLDSRSRLEPVNDLRTRIAKGISEDLQSRSLDLNLVVGVPDSSSQLAATIAGHLGLGFSFAVIRNHYYNGSRPSNMGLRIKYNVDRAQVTGKKVLLVALSSLSGRDLLHLCSEMQRHEAKQIHVAICSVPVRGCPVQLAFPACENFPFAEFETLKGEMKKKGADTLTLLSPEAVSTILGSGYCTYCLGYGDPPLVLPV